MTASSLAIEEYQHEAAPMRRVLVVDDYETIRMHLRMLDANRNHLDILTASSRGAPLYRLARTLAPDVVVMEFLDAPLSESARCLCDLKQYCHDIRVLMLTAHKERHFLDAALQSGADGYVLQDNSSHELELALHSLMAGNFFLSPAMCRQVISLYVSASGKRGVPGASSLTARERDVVALIAAGYRTREIAARLSLSEKTIEKHRGNISRKLELRGPAAVTAYAIANGYVHG